MHQTRVVDQVPIMSTLTEDSCESHPQQFLLVGVIGLLLPRLQVPPQFDDLFTKPLRDSSTVLETTDTDDLHKTADTFIPLTQCVGDSFKPSNGLVRTVHRLRLVGLALGSVPLLVGLRRILLAVDYVL